MIKLKISKIVLIIMITFIIIPFNNNSYKSYKTNFITFLIVFECAIDIIFSEFVIFTNKMTQEVYHEILANRFVPFGMNNYGNNYCIKTMTQNILLSVALIFYNKIR